MIPLIMKYINSLNILLYRSEKFGTYQYLGHHVWRDIDQSTQKQREGISSRD